MRILLANKFFYPKGGAETVFFQERDWLLANGHAVADFSMKHEENLESGSAGYFVPNVDYHDRLSLGRSAVSALRFVHNSVATKRIAELCDDFRPQIAHLHNIYHQLTPSIIPVLKEKGVKVVLTVHDGKLICPAYVMQRNGKPCTACSRGRFWNAAFKNCRNSLSHSLLLSVESLFHRFRGAYGQVDRIVSPSRFLADLVIDSGFPKEKVSVIKNGISSDGFIPESCDEGYALYYGRLSHEKGLNTLCQASENFQVPLRVVGTGPLYDTLKEQYPDVRFDGFLSGQSLRDAVRGAKCVVVPSEWFENCSMVVLESMALGKPVIGSRIGGIPEQVVHGKTGFLFEPGNVDELVDAVNAVAADDALCRRMGRAGRERLEQEYSLERHFGLLAALFEDLLSEGGAS